LAKRVFFSFHYQDVIDFRANVVRNHWVTKLNKQASGFFDASLWEDAKKTSDLAIKRLINSGLENTSATCVLIGSQTYSRRWVKYEIMKSINKGNQIIGVNINGIKDKREKTKNKGPNPFYYLGYMYSDDGKKLHLFELIEGKWTKYTDLDSYNLAKIAPESKRGKFYRLSTEYPTYDWIEDEGYKNFSIWVD
jgi:hypothetical protein